MEHVTPAPLKILVVEDDALQLRPLLRRITARGHEAVFACSVADALGRAALYDVAVLDLELPDGTGLEIAAGIAARRVVFVTGSCNEELLRLARAFGPVLTKPCSLWELIAEVERDERGDC